jgi:hypothetical protein
MRLPTWVTPAVAFNNTSSLPLLLLQTLQSTGSLKLITMPGQSESDCMNRAQSYFLVCAVASNTIAYAIGPRMLSHGDSTKKGNDQEGRHDQDEGVNVSGISSTLSRRYLYRELMHVQPNRKTDSVTAPSTSPQRTDKTMKKAKNQTNKPPSSPIQFEKRATACQPRPTTSFLTSLAPSDDASTPSTLPSSTQQSSARQQVYY